MNLGLKEELFTVLDSDPDGGYSAAHDDGRYSIALPSLPDWAIRLFTLYHEYAHVLFKDAEAQTKT